MNDLIYSCSEGLPQATTPVCGLDYGERVIRIILSKSRVNGYETPTAAQFDAAYSGLIDFKGITNGHRVFVGETEIEWHHKEWYDPIYKVEGRIRRVNEAMVRAVEKVNFYKELYIYYFTEKNYCFGPYECWPNFKVLQFEGKLPPYIAFDCQYVGNGIDTALYDADYPNINTEEIVSATFDSTTTTWDSTTLTFDQT